MRRLGTLALGALLIAGGAMLAAAQGWHSEGRRGWAFADRDRDSSRAYQDGFRQGELAARRNQPSRTHTDRWRGRDRQDYETGYQRGYQDAIRGNNRQGYPNRGIGGGSSGNYGGSGGYSESARRIGYQDGLNDGSKDRRTGHSFRPTQGDNYKHADRSYNSSFGNRDLYKQYYREGYTEGYRLGYYGQGGGIYRP
jgi:hypothetical protein